MTIVKKVLFPLLCAVLLMGNSSCLESCNRSAPVYEGDYPVGAGAVIRWADNKGIIDITFQNDTNKSIKDINVWLERYRSFNGHTYKSLDEEYPYQFSGDNVWLELIREDEHVSRLVDDSYNYQWSGYRPVPNAGNKVVLKAKQSQLYSFTLGPSPAWNYDLECDSDVVAYRCILRIYQIEFEGYGKMSFADEPIIFIFEGHQSG